MQVLLPHTKKPEAISHLIRLIYFSQRLIHSYLLDYTENFKGGGGVSVSAVFNFIPDI